MAGERTEREGGSDDLDTGGVEGRGDVARVQSREGPGEWGGEGEGEVVVRSSGARVGSNEDTADTIERK